MWDLSFPTRDQTHIPCIGRQSLNHWTTKEVFLEMFGLSGLAWCWNSDHQRAVHAEGLLQVVEGNFRAHSPDRMLWVVVQSNTALLQSAPIIRSTSWNCAVHSLLHCP